MNYIIVKSKKPLLINGCLPVISMLSYGLCNIPQSFFNNYYLLQFIQIFSHIIVKSLPCSVYSFVILLMFVNVFYVNASCTDEEIDILKNKAKDIKITYKHMGII